MLGPQTNMILQRVTETSDSLGGVSQSWINLRVISGVLTAGGNTSARFVGAEKMMRDRPTATSMLVFFCDMPVGITITEKDRLVLGSRVFDIEAVYNPGNMNHHLEITLFEVK